jgi:hypothetical protein
MTILDHIVEAKLYMPCYYIVVWTKGELTRLTYKVSLSHILHYLSYSFNIDQ